MERISVTPEMRERVLAGVAEALAAEDVAEVVELSEEEPAEEPVAERKGLRLFSGGRSQTRWLAVAACLLVALVVGVALFNMPTVEPDDTTVPGSVALANGMVEVASAEELSDAVGVPVSDVPALDGLSSSVTYVSLWGNVAEIDYQLDDNAACLRISGEPGDNSGDYNTYAVEETLEHAGATVTLKGGDEGYQLAIWDQGELGVSLRFDAPIDRNTLVSCVESVIDAL